MPIVSRILVATDFGESSTAAFRYAREFARAFSAELHVVHVVDDIQDRAATLPPPPVDVKALQAEYNADAQRKLDTLLAPNAAGHGAVSAVLTSSHTAAAILAYAAAHSVDLIVTGTHGRSGFVDLFMGSVAQQIVRTAPCPVVTLRGLPSGGLGKESTAS